MLTLCKIDGESYDVLITAIEERFEVAEGNNSGKSLYKDREIRDLKGVKLRHNITFSPDADRETFDNLCAYLFGALRESIMLEVVHDQKTITYEAAYNVGSRRVSYINDRDEVIGWAEMTVEFRSIEAVIT